MRKFIFVLLLFPIMVMASVPKWNIVPEESKLTFTGTMNDAPTSGTFKSFTGDIQLDPEKLDQSHVRMVIDVASLSTSYVDIGETLKKSDWLDVKVFPQAVFESNKIVKLDGKKYEAKGELTILGKKLPISITFSEISNIKDKVRVEGVASFKRLDFGIGKGAWSATSEVKDEVEVNFNLTVIRQH